jgi:hypothetical protein
MRVDVSAATALGLPVGAGAVRWWADRSHAERVALIALVGVLAAGGLLRGLLMAAWSPAFMGWPDAKSYLDVAHGELFSNVLRPAGYPMFVRALDGLHSSLSVLVVANHALGLGTAALLFAAVARAGAPPLLGLVPAAIVALNGDTAFLEHAPLSEPLFTFLVALAAYAGVRALEGPSAVWPVVAGLALGYATTVRVVGLALLPVFGVWLLAAAHGPLRRRARTTAIAAAAALALLGAYQAATYVSVGETGLSRHGAWHLYARVAGFADCSRFEPPAGTAALCERIARSDRGTVDQYLFMPAQSPAFRAFGDPFVSSDQHVAALGSFARTAIVHQPFDYLREVGGDMLRYVAPESMRRFGGGPSYADLVGEPILANPLYEAQGLTSVGAYYGPETAAYFADTGLLDALRGYEAATRVQGPLFVVLALLSLTAPLVLRGRARAAAALFAITAWALLVAPVAALEFSARTAVPGFGVLGAAAALGAWGWAVRASARTPCASPSPTGGATRA